MFGKKRLFAEMEHHVQIIQLALAEAALLEVGKEGRRTAAAIANLLVGKSSPGHTDQEQQLARDRVTARDFPPLSQWFFSN